MNLLLMFLPGQLPVKCRSSVMLHLLPVCITNACSQWPACRLPCLARALKWEWSSSPEFSGVREARISQLLFGVADRYPLRGEPVRPGMPP